MSARISALNLEGFERYQQPAKDHVDRQRFHVQSGDVRPEHYRVSKIVHNPIQWIKNTFNRLQCYYHTNVSLLTRRRISQVFRGIGKGGAFLGSAYTIIDPILKIFRNSAEFRDSKWGISNVFYKRILQTKLFSFIGVFISLRSIGDGISSISSFCKIKLTIIVDKVLEIFESIGDLFYNMETFIDGLKACQICKAGVGLSSVMECFAIIGAVFGIATIVQNIKIIFENSRFSSELLELFGDQDQPNMKAVVIKIRRMSDDIIAKKFGVADGAALKARINAIYLKTKDSDSVESKKECIATMSALKTRLSLIDKNVKLKIIAAVVSTIASVILIAISGALIGHILLATASAVGVVVIFLEYKGERDLNIELEKIAPDNSHEMQSFFKRKQLKEQMKWDPAYRGICFQSVNV